MYMYMYNLFEARSPVFSLEAGIFSELNKRQITELYNYIITMRNHSKKSQYEGLAPASNRKDHNFENLVFVTCTLEIFGKVRHDKQI